MMNTKSGSMALVLSFLLLAGCATTSPENKFAETRLAADAFRVSYVGQPKMQRQEAELWALLHAAELTVEDGFQYFVVTESHTSMQSRTGTVPITVTGANPMREGMSAASTTATQTRYESYNYQVPVAELEFSMFKERPAVEAGFHDARVLLAARKNQ